MEELTKQVSKMGETLNKVLENQEFMRNDISKMQRDISGMQGDISGMKQDISGMQGNISGMKQDISGVQGEISGMKQDISGVQGDISGMKGEILSLKQGQEEIIKKIDKMYFKLDDGIETARVLLNQHEERIERLEEVTGI